VKDWFKKENYKQFTHQKITGGNSGRKTSQYREDKKTKGKSQRDLGKKDMH